MRPQPPTSNLQPSTWNPPPPTCSRSASKNCPPATSSTRWRSSRPAVPKLLDDLRLAHGGIRVYASPRRLVVLIEALAGRQANQESLVKGPPAERAFDASGAATPAAVGFARKNGVPVESLEVRPEGNGRYVFAVVRSEGRSTRRSAARRAGRAGRGHQVRQDHALERDQRRLLAADPLVRLALGRHGRPVHSTPASSPAGPPAARGRKARPSWR